MLGSLGAESLGKLAIDTPVVARIRPTRALIRPKARFAPTALRREANANRLPRSAHETVRTSAANASR
jgi:hypothetical protein